MIFQINPLLSSSFVRVSQLYDAKESKNSRLFRSSSWLLTGPPIETLFASWTRNWMNINYVLQRLREKSIQLLRTRTCSIQPVDFAVLRGRCYYVDSIDRYLYISIGVNDAKRYVLSNSVIFQKRNKYG